MVVILYLQGLGVEWLSASISFLVPTKCISISSYYSSMHIFPIYPKVGDTFRIIDLNRPQTYYSKAFDSTCIFSFFLHREDFFLK